MLTEIIRELIKSGKNDIIMSKHVSNWAKRVQVLRVLKVLKVVRMI